MDRITLILMFAVSGLSTAANLLTAKAIAEEAKAKTAPDSATKAALLKSADHDRALAKVLMAADTGVQSYLSS